MEPALVLAILIGITLLAYLYTRTWRNPEGFGSSPQPSGQRSRPEGYAAPPSSSQVQQEKAAEKQRQEVVVEEELTKPYATEPIRSVDDYEYSLVFKNEGDRAMTKAVRDQLMNTYPQDWSVQPPSSALFQQGLAAYKEAFQNPPPAQQGNPYREIDGSSMIPPDTLEAEKKEKEILSTYVPKDPQALTTYDAEDARELIRRIYDAKGLVADYKQTGDNQFTVVGTRKKDEKIVYEDDPQLSPSSTQPLAQAGEGTIIVPAVAAEVQSGLDPFYTPGTRTRDAKWDYTRWTPGLERMFAPTEPQTNWY